MTDDYLNTPEPYSRTIEALLDHERIIVERPAIVRARVLARARESLRDADRIAVASSRSRYFVRVFVAAAAGVALMVSVAAAYQMMRRPVTSQPAPVRRQPAAASVVPTPTPVPAPPPALASPAPDEERLGSPSPSRRLGRAAVEELRLLDRARQSDARGDYAGVLDMTAEHERHFPDGRLAEEREVLRVRALVSLGRDSEARQAASKFRHEFPRSVLLRRLDDMLKPSR